MAKPLSEIRDLRLLFLPRSIAVIGASRDGRSMSGQLAANLAASYRGPLYLINPNAAEVAGRQAYRSLSEVPDPIDLVFVAVRAEKVLAAARECARRQMAMLVVISAGFSEIGSEGARRERELLEIAQGCGMRVLGPNCFGVCNTGPNSAFNGTFSPLPPTPGTVAVGTQSGAIGAIIPDYARVWNFGLSSFASLGNKADITEHELVEWWGNDPDTRVIVLYLESLSAPRELLKVGRLISRHKPIVVLHAGTTTGGARAAASHTAALAGSQVATEAVLRQAGMVVAEDLEQLLETAAVLACQPLPSGRRVAVLTNAGGPAVISVDALLRAGLEVPELSGALQSQLALQLPAEAARRNPVDLIGSIDAAQYRACLDCLLASDECDAVIAAFVPRILDSAGEIVRTIDEAASAAAAAGCAKPVLPVIMQSDFARTAVRRGSKLPVFEYPHAAARALARAAEYTAWKSRADRAVQELLAEPRSELASWAEELPATGDWLDPERVFRLLSSAGFAVAPWRTVRTAVGAVEAAAELGGPVVLKAIAPGLIHKARSGGVLLDIEGPALVAAAFSRLLNRVPGCREVVVQPYYGGGSELLMGVTWEERFGHLVAFGAGGTEVETYRDVAFRLAPLTRGDCEDLLAATRVGQKLLGHTSPLRDPLLRLLQRLSALVGYLPQIREFDLNPVKTWPDGRLVVVDARLRCESALYLSENRLLG